MAETLKLGNGEWATKDGSLLAYNNESGNYKPLPFDFTRASSATVVNKAGLIETVQSGIPRIDFLGNTNGALLLEPQRTNLITQSEAFGISYWTKSGATIEGDASTAGSELIINVSRNSDFSAGATNWSDAGNHTVSVVSSELQVVSSGVGGNSSNAATLLSASYVNTLTNGVMYKYTFSARASTGTPTLRVRPPFETGPTTSDFVLSTSMQEFTFYGTRENLDNAFFSLLSAGTFYIDNVSVKEVQGFTSPSADSPLNAFKLVEDTSTGQHNTSSTVLVNAGDNSFSMYVKANGRRYISLYTNSRGSENDQYGFDLNGVGSVTYMNTNGSATITSLNNGWYRVTITHPSTGFNTRLWRIYTSDVEVTSATLPSYTGDGTSGVYIFGAQLEQASYPTSYIPTQGSTVTVVAEVCSDAGNDQVINSTEGVLYVEGSALADDFVDKRIAISDGSTNNYVSIGYSRFAGNIIAEIWSGGVNQVVNWGATGVTKTNNNKFALSWGSGTMKFYINGTQTNTESATSPIGMNVLDFTSGNGTLPMYANTKDVRVYNTALTDAELITLTT